MAHPETLSLLLSIQSKTMASTVKGKPVQGAPRQDIQHETQNNTNKENTTKTYNNYNKTK